MESRRALLAVFVVILCGTQVFAEEAKQERIGIHPRDSGSQINTSAFSLPGNDVVTESKMILMDGGVAITVGEIGEERGISADRVVILSTLQRDDVDIYDTEIYLEGNVVFGNGQDRVIANRLYYDVTSGVRVITDSDILSGDLNDDSDAETIRTAIRKIASRAPDNPKKRDLKVGDKVVLTFTGDLASLFSPRRAGFARFADLQPDNGSHVQSVGKVVNIQPNGNLLVESASMRIAFGKRSVLQTISGEIHPSRIQSGKIRGEDLESLAIVLKEREDTQAKIDASLFEQGILRFPDDVEKAMMRDAIQHNKR